jgi:hypothetical protein
VENREKIQAYLNNLRRHLSALLRPGLGTTLRAFPTRRSGGVVEVLFTTGQPSHDIVEEPRETLGEVLKVVPQRLIDTPDFSGIRFGGTNISMEPNRIVLIKGEDSDLEWNDAAAARDVQRIASPVNRR